MRGSAGGDKGQNFLPVQSSKYDERKQTMSKGHASASELSLIDLRHIEAQMGNS